MEHIDENHQKILDKTLYTIQFLYMTLIGYESMSIHGKSYIGGDDWDAETDEALDAWQLAVNNLDVENPFIKVSVDM
jgi:hypothetical protein